jgi:hypothetical protein
MEPSCLLARLQTIRQMLRPKSIFSHSRQWLLHCGFQISYIQYKLLDAIFLSLSQKRHQHHHLMLEKLCKIWVQPINFSLISILTGETQDSTAILVLTLAEKMLKLRKITGSRSTSKSLLPFTELSSREELTPSRKSTQQKT